MYLYELNTFDALELEDLAGREGFFRWVKADSAVLVARIELLMLLVEVRLILYNWPPLNLQRVIKCYKLLNYSENNLRREQIVDF